MASRTSIRILAAGLMLAALAWLAFGGALDCGFVYFDDNLYVLENEHLADGFSMSGLRWAFTTGYAANWHPLTWLSLFADHRLYGPDQPAGYHLTNLLLHALNILLLFGFLRQVTGRFWAPLLVAALWGVHPLRVESVVWISERKDVLATAFGLLALLAYGGGAGRRPAGRQVLVAACFLLNLMSKPTWVTLPFLLLLLDVWPLRRWPAERAGALIREKIPLFLLSAGSCIATFLVQRAGGAVIPSELAPAWVRLANSWVAYAEYVRLLFWPFRLAVFYPHPGVDMPAARIWGSLAVLALLTALAVRGARRRPWVLVGWLWFLGSLVPMIGWVQVGAQAWADRYTYLPHIGLLVALVWSVAEGAEPASRRWSRAGVVAGFGLAAGLVLLSSRQTRIWRDSETLFRSALANTENNARMHMSLGTWCHLQGREAEALEHLRWSLAIQPRLNEARYNLANLYRETGRPEDAMREYRAMIAEVPRHSPALNNLARMLAADPAADVPQAEEALELAQRAVAAARPSETWDDTLALAHWKMGKCLAAEGRRTEAEGHFRQSLASKPEGNRAAFDLARLHEETGRKAEAVREYRAVIAGIPRHVDALNNLAWLLASDPHATPEQAAEALELARRAIEAGGGPAAGRLDTLAVAQAAAGDFEGAARTAEQATELAKEQGDEPLADEIGRRLENFRGKKAWHE